MGYQWNARSRFDTSPNLFLKEMFLPNNPHPGCDSPHSVLWVNFSRPMGEEILLCVAPLPHTEMTADACLSVHAKTIVSAGQRAARS